MFFWFCSRYSLRKSFIICNFFAVYFLTYGQETQTEDPLFSIPNKPILGIMNNENSIEDFSFLNKKEETNKSLFAKEKYLDTSAPYLKRLRKREEDNANLGYLGDTYLGDVNTISNKAIIVCRDFEYEDGDRVEILLNDEVIIPNLYLKNQFFVMQIDLKPGFNILELHLGFENEELKAMMIDHPDWGAKWRELDLQIVESEKFKNYLKEKNIKLINWNQINKIKILNEQYQN